MKNKLMAMFALSAALTAAASGGGERVRYSSMLRVGVHVLFDGAAERDFWAALAARPGAFDELMIFTQNNHAVRPVSYHRMNAPRVEKFLRKAEKLGYRTGVNIIPTIGFGTDAYDPATAHLPMAVRTDNGELSPGRLCRTAPETLGFIREVYGLYAATRPQFIYVDDDVSAGPCQCPRCCRKALGVADRAAMHAIFDSDDVSVRRDVAERWLEFAEDGVNDVFAAAAGSVHAVDPKIALGFMTYTCGDVGHDPARWAATLAGGGGLGAVRWRPGGGAHNDYSFQELVRKVLAMSMQITGLPDEVTLIQGEIENFPFQTLRKSPSYMNFEALMYLALGCTSIAWDIDGFNGRDMEAMKPYYDAASRIRPAAEKVVAAFGRAPSDGVAFPWTKRSGMRIGEKGFIAMSKGVPLPKDFAAVGLPVASDPKLAKVFLLDRSTALELSDEELRRVLSKAALLDPEALETVNARGFGALTGFKVSAKKPPVDAIARDLDHPLNVEGRNFCDVRQCFGVCKPILALEKTDDKAEYTSETVDYDGNPLGGFAGGVFENSAGGRVAVEALSTFAWYESRSRSIHLKRLMRYLSRDGLDAYLASFHRAMIFARGGGAFVANLANEPMTGGEVALRGGRKWKVSIFGGGLVISETVLSCLRNDGAYGILTLPEIPVNGQALIERLDR